MSPFQTVILSLFSLFIITTSLHCNITGTRQTQAVSNLDLIYNVSPLKLSFQQSSGYLISDIAAQIPKEIVDASNNPHFEPCVMDYHSGLIPYLNLVLLDNIFPPASNTNQNQLWSDINNNDSWVHKSTTYLSTVHLSASERSPVVIKMKYCRDYKSLQEINMECPPIDTAAELARLHNKSKKPLAIGLGFLAIGVVLISIAVFSFLYTKYEQQADYKQQLSIKKTKLMLAAELKTPEEAHAERQYEVANSSFTVHSESGKDD